jgi:hypothetical protein
MTTGIKHWACQLGLREHSTQSYLHDQVWPVCAHARDSNARLGRAVGSSGTYRLSVRSQGGVGRDYTHPKIIWIRLVGLAVVHACRRAFGLQLTAKAMPLCSKLAGPSTIHDGGHDVPCQRKARRSGCRRCPWWMTRSGGREEGWASVVGWDAEPWWCWSWRRRRRRELVDA